MGRKAFMFHEEWAQVLSSLPPEMRHCLADALIDYFLNGIAPNFSDPAVGAIFQIFKNRMDADDKHYESKCEKSKQAIKKRWERKKNTNEYDSIPTNTDVYDSIPTNTDVYDSIPTNTDVGNINLNLNSNLNTNLNLNSNLNDDVNIILSQRPSIVEAIQRKYKLTQSQVYQYGKDFNDHCRIGLTTHKNEQDHLQHFRDWLKIQIQEQKKHGTNNSTSYEQRAEGAAQLVAKFLAEGDEARNEGAIPIDF